ncbi:SMC family ATPase [Sinomonas halotolerans]
MTAFGPFAGREQVDFDALAEHGLFLLNGPTGAGKTSILDAVCFALYGSLPGAREGTRALKSHHAAAEAEPEVLLEFSAQDRRFEVRRTPEWSKPSRRASTGWVTQKASTHVRELVDGQWRALTSRNDEAGALLSDVLGMGREQFTRVVLLPQGEFASFLRSKAGERIALLEKLFGTGRFADIEAQLGQLAQAARAEAENAERSAALPIAQLEAESAELSAAAFEPGAPAPEPVPADIPGPGTGAASPEGLLLEPEPVRERFAAVERAYAELAASALDQAAAARAEQGKAQEAAAAAARALEDAEELAGARARREAWEAEQPEHARRLEALESHRAALGAEPLLAALDRARRDLEDAEDRAWSATADAQAAGWSPCDAAGGEDAEHCPAGAGRRLPAPEAVHSAAAAAAAESAVLAERLPAEKDLGELEGRLARMEAEAGRLARSRATKAAALEEARAEAVALESQREGLEPRASALALARAEAERARKVLDAVEDHVRAAAALTAAQTAHTACRREALDAKERWLALREQRLEQSAAELAALLEAGGACPVCGAVEHPAPAQPEEEPLLLADAERRAGDEAERAAQAEREAHESVAAAQAALAASDARGGAVDPDKAARLLEDALGALAAAESASADLARVVTRLGAARARRDSAASAVEEASAASVRAEEAVALLRGEAERRRGELMEWLAGFASLSARAADAAARARTLGALEQALAVVSTARAASTRAHGDLALALTAGPFREESAARAALMTADDASALAEATTRHEAEGQQLGGLFASASAARAAQAEAEGRHVGAADLAQARAVAADAEERSRRADLAAHAATAGAARTARLAAEFETAVPELERTRARADLLTGLARTARGQGDNGLRMSLHSYVLAARLEQVAVAATERLVAMSDGRFSLEHTDALAARGASSGLGLQIVDAWTGQRRDPSTLSGGESFMASLALALGLADVVQHEAGGIDIETLFVDEGFGSLDEQSLEQVMDAIEGLRAGGRVVGLVSHVGELKQRIGAQIRVTKGRAGSRVELVGVG